MSQKENVRELIQSTTVPHDEGARLRAFRAREPVHIIDMPSGSVWVRMLRARNRTDELDMLLTQIRGRAITEAKLKKKWGLTPEESQALLAIAGVAGVLRVERNGKAHAYIK